MDPLSLRVAQRYAKSLGEAEFTKLMLWVGPKAHEAHRKFPKGRREFDTRTRVLRFNIAPEDYLRYDIEEAKARMGQGAQLAEVVNPKAYAAMRGVLQALKARQVKFRMINVPWTRGGSYVEAMLPQPKAQEPQADPWQKDYGIR
jgi:hypothetical protein